LDKGCHHEGWRLIEVYDDAEKACGTEIATKEALATRRRIVFVDVRPVNCVEYRCYMVEHLGPAPPKVLFGALVKQHSAPGWIGCFA
jgi:hypothetical protein